MRVWVTDLEMWRYWRMRPDATTDDLLKGLRREFPKTEPMKVGTAVHSVAEVTRDFRGGSVPMDGYIFHQESDQPFAECEEHEVRVEVEVAGATLSGRVDGIRADGGLIEWKTSTRAASLSAERYFHSWQWRVYLLATGAPTVTYETVQLAKVNAREYRILRLRQFVFWPYAGMAGEVAEATSEFVALVRGLGWEGQPDRVEAEPEVAEPAPTAAPPSLFASLGVAGFDELVSKEET